MFTVYILYSSTHHKIYIGYTSDLLQRFKFHNFLATKGYTIRYRPWIVLHTEIYATREEATHREQQLKGGQGRQWIHSHILPLYQNVGFITPPQTDQELNSLSSI